MARLSGGMREAIPYLNLGAASLFHLDPRPPHPGHHEYATDESAGVAGVVDSQIDEKRRMLVRWKLCGHFWMER